MSSDTHSIAPHLVKLLVPEEPAGDHPLLRQTLACRNFVFLASVLLPLGLVQ